MAQGHAAHGAPEAAPAGGLSPDRGTRWQGMCFEVSFTCSCSGAEEAEGWVRRAGPEQPEPC